MTTLTHPLSSHLKGLFAGYQPAGYAAVGSSFGATLWGIRSLDILGQVAVIFAGVFGVLALLREKPLTARQKLPTSVQSPCSPGR